MQQVNAPEEYLIWGFHTKVLWRMVIQFFHHLIDLFRRNIGPEGAFCKVLSDQDISILVEPWLLSSIRMYHIEVDCQALTML